MYQALDAAATSPRSRSRLRRFSDNRELRLDNIDVIGFDYDYTLASYKTQLQELIYNQGKHVPARRAAVPDGARGQALRQAVRGARPLL